MNTRTEYDTIGPVEVPANQIWGAQTQRSVKNFEIGTFEDKIPKDVVKSIAIVKKACAKANLKFGLNEEIAKAIMEACDEILEGKHDAEFPLVTFQTGSGTQSNMNANEVIANIANLRTGRDLGDKSFVHPNDHCNKSQSSNDTFPTGMHVAVFSVIKTQLIPAIERLYNSLLGSSEKQMDIIKLGRTHLQDATPLSLGQELSGYAALVKNGLTSITVASEKLLFLAQGGTAVGTGLNTPKGFDQEVASNIAEITGFPFKTASNKFESLSSHDAVAYLSGEINGFSTSLFKVANDLRLLNSLFNEISFGELAACEEVMQSCIQAMGNHSVVSVGSTFIRRHARTL